MLSLFTLYILLSSSTPRSYSTSLRFVLLFSPFAHSFCVPISPYTFSPSLYFPFTFYNHSFSTALIVRTSILHPLFLSSTTAVVHFVPPVPPSTVELYSPLVLYALALLLPSLSWWCCIAFTRQWVSGRRLSCSPCPRPLASTRPAPLQVYTPHPREMGRVCLLMGPATPPPSPA